MSERAPCVRCGRILHTGEGRILVAFTVDELADIARRTMNPTVAERVLCALGLLNPDLEKRMRASDIDPNEPHEFAGDRHDCEVCGEGACYYLHADRPENEP